MANGKTNKTNTGEKRKSAAAEAFGKLSRRERAMIFALIAIGVACALFFFVVQPGFDRLSNLETEAAQAEETQDTYLKEIAAGSFAAEEAAAATAAYDAAMEQIFSPMTIETLDSTTTGYLEDAGFDPETLSMSQLQQEDMTPFSPQPLSDSPVPEIVDTQQAEPGVDAPADGAAADGDAADGDAADSDTAGGDAADSDTTGEEPADPDNPPVESAQPVGSFYSYSVNISALGGWNNLYKLLDILADINGVELTQYAYSEGSGEGSDKGSFSLTINFYVFIEGAVAETGETPT
jgi:hypothetical protein